MKIIAKEKTFVSDFTVRSLLRFIGITMLTVFAAVTLVACGGGGGGASTDTGTPSTGTPSGGVISGFVNYSYDKNTVFFNTASNYIQTVFMDTFWPFDPTVRMKSSDPLVKYKLDYKPVITSNIMVVALPDLMKLYAPYFSFTANGDVLTVTHHFFSKKVTAGAGSRAPTLDYTKIVYEGTFTIGSTSGTKTVSTYATVNSINAIATAAVATKVGPTNVTLDLAPSVTNGVIYVPVASFLTALGKTITTNSGFIAASSVAITDTTNDLFNPTYQNTTTDPYKYAGITALRVTYMNGVLGGTIKTGNFWNGFWLGDTTVFTGSYDATGNDITKVMAINRILPYRLYVPANYTPNQPRKFTFSLHGGTGSENAVFERPNDHYANQTPSATGVAHDTVEHWSDLYNYIVLSPNGWTSNPIWGSGPGEQSLLTAYNLVKLDYKIDPDKQFIMGNSLGGGGTMNFAVRHPEMFKAMSAQAPASGPSAADWLGSAAKDLPLLLVQGTADVTVYYKPNTDSYNQALKNILSDVTFMAIEQGHHSYAWASAYEAIYQFFDRALETVPKIDVKEVFFTAGSTTAYQTNSTNQQQTLRLTTAPILSGTTVLVTLADLARIYGPTFNYYKVYAYDTVPANLASAVTTIYDNISVNIALPGVTGNVLIPRYLRVGASFHAGDTIGGSTVVLAGDPSIDPRTLSVAPSTDASGNIFVPVVEFMELYGKTVYAN